MVMLTVTQTFKQWDSSGNVSSKGPWFLEKHFLVVALNGFQSELASMKVYPT